MARAPSLYPPSPKNVPEDLTEVTPHYRLHVFVVLLNLFVFFFLYLGILFGSLLAILWALWPLFRGNLQGVNPFVRVVVGTLAFLLFLYLFKGFFKRGRRQKSLEIEITEEEHPKLFNFLERLCDETGAPFPHRVYVDPEVNAAVFCNNSVLSLFWPPPKNLLIGLGLVNSLNLTEFKSVLAHEFGHFSQKSMRVSGYAYIAQNIITDLVVGRDWLDDLLDRWCELDIRVAIFGWVCKGILWVLRKLLAGFYYLIVFLQRSLMREMEYHADLVAVSVTGSDAGSHVLARLRFAEESLHCAAAELRTAADHRLYTSDLFHHQSQASGYIRKLRKDPQLGQPAPLPDDPEEIQWLFDPNDEAVPSMWATHPTNYEREQNAKEYYIRSKFDLRSPWLLFDKPEELRERVTWRWYRVVMNVPKTAGVAEAEEVQAFINDERAETTYDPRYHGLYDGRTVNPGVIAELVQETAWDAGRLLRAHSRLYDEQLKTWMQEHNERVEEFNLLRGLLRGDLQAREGEFKFRGRYYESREARRLFKKVDKELQVDHDWLCGLDHRVFVVHYQMATQSGQKAEARELVERYQFHVKVQQILRGLLDQEAEATSAIGQLTGKRQLVPGEFRELLNVFRQAHRTLAEGLDMARDVILPALKNMKAGKPLRPFLLEKRLVYALRRGDNSIQGNWIHKFMQQLTEVLDKMRRIHFKSLGGILQLQERIGQKCVADWAALPQVVMVEEDDLPPQVLLLEEDDSAAASEG